jgi:hypothetical protein
VAIVYHILHDKWCHDGAFGIDLGGPQEWDW